MDSTVSGNAGGLSFPNVEGPGGLNRIYASTIEIRDRHTHALLRVHPRMAHAGSVVNGPMSFKPIAASAYAEETTDPVILNSEPWVIPQGYVQTIVSDESDLDIYKANDWLDMNTVTPCSRVSSSRSSRISTIPAGSSPLTGSSKRSSFGSCRRALASPSRWALP